jgi:predicted secreted Zn-dependent protease
LILGKGGVLEGKDNVEKNSQESIQPPIIETNDGLQVEESSPSSRKLKQEQLQKLSFMVKAMSKKGQTEDQLRNNLNQMGWPNEALDQSFEGLS